MILIKYLTKTNEVIPIKTYRSKNKLNIIERYINYHANSEWPYMSTKTIVKIEANIKWQII